MKYQKQNKTRKDKRTGIHRRETKNEHIRKNTTTTGEHNIFKANTKNKKQKDKAERENTQT